MSIQAWDYNLGDSSKLMKDFVWRLDGCANRHAPLKKLNAKEIKLKSKPWITPEISKMIKIRDKLFTRKKRQPNNEDIKQYYNIFRNRVNREIKRSKKSYYTLYFDNHKK